MKVTKLKKGYRIRLSDSEFAALSELVDHGVADFEGEDSDEHTYLKGRVRRLIFDGGFSLAVNEDRRGA